MVHEVIKHFIHKKGITKYYRVFIPYRRIYVRRFMCDMFLYMNSLILEYTNNT